MNYRNAGPVCFAGAERIGANRNVNKLARLGRKELDGTILIDFLFRSEDSIPVKRFESINQAGKAGESFL